jgi:MFS family permease
MRSGRAGIRLLYFFRALTGAGMGGEYAAVNAAIDELIPAREWVAASRRKENRSQTSPVLWFA